MSFGLLVINDGLEYDFWQKKNKIFGKRQNF